MHRSAPLSGREGLGAPLVISVILFLVYYVIDNTGFKNGPRGILACLDRDMALYLCPAPSLGIFVTYKAMNDSAVFNADLYKGMAASPSRIA